MTDATPAQAAEWGLPPFSVREVVQALSEQIDWGLKFAGVPEVWKQTQGRAKNGRRVRVGVIDTGAVLEHPDLKAAIVGAEDFTGDRRFGPADRNGHGTHCAGIIGARADGNGIKGVAPESEIFVLRALDAKGSGASNWLADAIDAGCDNDCQILSCSWGSPAPDERIGRAIERATAKGVFVIAAAGNSGQPNDVNFPARWKGRPNADRDCIAVAAFDESGKLAPFSSRGPEVDIAAPGVNVLSTYLNNGYAELSGTSMATPFVAGVVALLLARHWDLEPAKTPLETLGQLREHLRKSSKDAGPAGRDDGYGFGLINPAELFKQTEPEPPPAADRPFWNVELPLIGKVTIYTPAAAGDLLTFGIRRG